MSSATRGDGRDDPLLLVHGYMDTRHTPWWTTFHRQFGAAGYDTDRIHSLDQGSVPMTTVGSPRAYAERIVEAARSLSESFDSEVDVLAHSMGGLSARWAVEHLDGDRYVDDLVTLGTPHQGTSLAYLGAATPGGRAMIPGSSFLDALNDGSLARDVEYTAIWSDADKMIDPCSNATLSAEWFPTMLGARNVRLEGVSHMGLVSDASLVDRYLEYLG